MEQALRREMWEELKIKVRNMKLISKALYVASNGERQNSHCFLIIEYDGESVSGEAQELFWTSRIEDLSLEADRLVLKKSSVPLALQHFDFKLVM